MLEHLLLIAAHACLLFPPIHPICALMVPLPSLSQVFSRPATPQAHCWFLSCLVPYWLAFDLVARKVVLRLERLSTVCKIYV